MTAKNHYTALPTEVKEKCYGISEKTSWKPFLRQLFISSGLWTPYISVGMYVGTTTVYIPQVRRAANSTDAVSMEMVSWLSSVYAYASIPAVFLLVYLTTSFGRKRTYNFISPIMIVVSTGYYVTTEPMHMLITGIIQGIPGTAVITVGIMAIVEYTSPRYRGVMLTIKTANIFWTIWIVNAIGTFTDWRYMCILSYINSLYSLTSFFWPESPTWLASQGRFEECRKVHRWLKGVDEDSEMELEKLIQSQIEAQKNSRKGRTLGFVVDKLFYMPVILSCLTMMVHQFSGKQVCIAYALDILKRITNNESTAYTGMLILDGVSVLCMYVGSFASKVLKRRTLLFVTGSLAAIFLLTTSLYLYLVHLEIFVENSYISIALLVGFSIAIGLGPIILATSLYGELISVKYKKESVIVIALVFDLLQANLLKVSPQIFNSLDMHGMYLFNGLSISVCLVILFIYLPETKDKTMHEIEEYFQK